MCGQSGFEDDVVLDREPNIESQLDGLLLEACFKERPATSSDSGATLVQRRVVDTATRDEAVDDILTSWDPCDRQAPLCLDKHNEVPRAEG